LRTGENATELLVIERATHERDPWSGHLAFPGGRAEVGDADGRHTAIRETREELGLDLQLHGRFLGAWDSVRSAGPGLPNLQIEPYAFAVERVPPLRPDPREVQRVFWVPVGPLLRGECDTSVEIRRRNQRFSMPGYEVEDRVLWGLSYRMLRSFFNLVHER
jgi:8-oxo-dGTP pyrophosphatase MutT (NUDIX family)